MNTMKASVHNASLLMFAQIISRCLTFSLNQILLRYLSPVLLATIAQFDLYISTIQFFSRENHRIAVQRVHVDEGNVQLKRRNIQLIINSAWLTFTAGLILLFLISQVYCRYIMSTSLLTCSHILSLYSVACLIELAAEPAFVTIQRANLYGFRAGIECCANLVKCLAILAGVYWLDVYGLPLTIFPFAFGQLVFAITLFLGYFVKFYSIFANTNVTILPKHLKPSNMSHDKGITYIGLFSKPVIYITGSLTLQSIGKYFLTQGDSLLMIKLLSLQDQGAYAFAANLGGLVARLVFQPIEESSRNYFANVFAVFTNNAKLRQLKYDHQNGVDNSSSTNTQIESITTNTDDNLTQACDSFNALLHVYALMSLFSVSCGPTLVKSFLRILWSKNWSNNFTANTLHAYCYYIPILATNGITEGFVAAVASPRDMRRQLVAMVLFSLIFTLTAYVLVARAGLGGVGIVIANCVNLGLRILWNITFLRAYFHHIGIQWSLIKSMPCVGSLFVALTLATLNYNGESTKRLDESTIRLLIRQFCVAGTGMILILWFERKFFLHWYSIIRGRKKDSVKLPSKLC